MAKPGPRLVIFTRTDQQPELFPGDVWALDRKFLTGADDDERFHARNPPIVFYGHNSWYLSNNTPDQELVLYGPNDHVDRIRAKTGRPLEVGESVLLIVDQEVVFLVDRAPAPAKGARWPIPDPAVKITDSPQLAAESELQDLLNSKSTFRTIIYTRFQEYILPLELARRRAGRANKPRHLNAQEVIKCYPDVTLVQVNEASRTIRSITGLELHEIGPWLVDRGLLLATHNIDIPHVECGHQFARG